MKKYRPSNGAEGADFQERFCARCEHDHFADGGESCSILIETMVYDVADPEYPSEWTYDERGCPTCTAFIPEGQEAHYKDDVTEDMFSE